MIHLAGPRYLGNEIAYVTWALENHTLSRGNFVDRFERAFAEFIGVKHAIATNNGTSALHAALLALGVGEGDRVIVPATTYIATANAVRYCGAEPFFVDVQPTTWTINWSQVEHIARTYVIAGVIPVHLYGVPALDRMPGIEHWKFCLEDAAEAHGAFQGGRRVGSIGAMGIFSFYGNKILTCGEGGMITTNDDRLAKLARKIIGVGQSEQRYIHDMLGYNYRMTELCGAFGLAQVECAVQHLAIREELGHRYRLNLTGKVRTQTQSKSSVDWVFPVLIPNRDSVAKELFARGIETRPVFPPLHLQPIYHNRVSLPVAEQLGREGLLLPLHANMTVKDVDYICNELLERVPNE